MAKKLSDGTENILQNLSEDEDEDVRASVALNPNTDSKILKILSEDENEYVRECVAWNPNTDAKTLKILSEDEEYSVREMIAQKTKRLPEDLKSLSKEAEYIRCRVALNQSITPQLMLAVSKDPSSFVRRDLARHPI